MNIEKILLIVIIIYLIFSHSKKNKNIEKFALSTDDRNEVLNLIRPIIKEIYNTDMSAIRDLDKLAKDIQSGGYSINGDLTVTGTITGGKQIQGSISGSASSATKATSADSATKATSAGSAGSATSASYVTDGIKNGPDYVLYNSSGKIGIGTQSPEYPIDVSVKLIATTTHSSAYWFGSKSPGSLINSNNILDTPIAMRLNGSVWMNNSDRWAGFWTTSDRRIKKNINYDISSECLNLIRKLRCSNYSYIDDRQNKTSVYGYIAQDVSEIIPYAVTTQTGFIPNIYSLAKINKENDCIIITCLVNKIYTLNNNHENNNNKIKLFDVNMKEFIVKIKKIIDNGVFMIEDDENINLIDNKYFVYGQEVNDFKILNNEAITIISSAALKEVDKKQQEDEIRIAKLESIIANQEIKIANQEIKIANQEIKIANQEIKIANQEIIINNILERLNKLEM
jgi:hypothetical protein